MMLSKRFYTLFILLINIIVLASCNGGNSENDLSNGSDEQMNQERIEDAYEAYIAKIDLDDSLKVTNSLYFTKEDGSSLSVIAFLNEKEEVVKLIEKNVDGITNRYQTTTYYVKNGRKYITNEHFEDTIDKSNPQFIERISFYDEKEMPINTRIRKAQYEEDLDKNIFQNVPVYNCPIERALQVINQQGKYVPKFQGLVFSGRTTYITVGEDDEEGFISALLIQYENETTRKMRKNQNALIGKPLDLQFQKVMDDNGFEFQLLLGVKEAKN